MKIQMTYAGLVLFSAFFVQPLGAKFPEFCDCIKAWMMDDNHQTNLQEDNDTCISGKMAQMLHLVTIGNHRPSNVMCMMH